MLCFDVDRVMAEGQIGYVMLVHITVADTEVPGLCGG